ncbi:type IV pilin protein [Thioalkalivibrio thiocyanodenitrificans]|uniref:type IV pilin protein n=1 Tax=Thioalkalivibrio thiocyanodenitrificans TaxID=243063 RepID=UPI000374E151|nr:type IV pilin protein [Thioalkalivibrio thiocyanodenitrificans]
MDRNRGFTLIEVMIVVVIVAILGTIAYGAYTRHIQDSRVATVQGDLMELAQWVERRYSLNNSYAGITTANLPFSISPRNPNSTTAYNIALGNVTATTFTLTATPTGPQAGHRCGALSLDQAGQRTAAENDCWR